MKKRQALKIRPFLIKWFIGFNCLLAFSPPYLPAANQGSPSLNSAEQAGVVSELEGLLTKLKDLEEPVSREGAGYLIAQAPGERYKLQFRLIARSPGAFRLELFDLFGRPAWYLISYAGETRLFSPSQQKEIPFGQMFSGPFAAISQMPSPEITKIFWGRVPLLPFEKSQVKSDLKAGQESIRLIFEGAGRQEIFVTPNPFTLLKSLITPTPKAEEIEITFSDFSLVAGNRLPLTCEVRQKERLLVIHYETVIPREDIPNDVFHLP